MSRPKFTRKTASHDWNALKLEWLAGDKSLKQFAIEKNIPNEANFYHQVKKGGWVASRKRLEAEVAFRVEEKLVQNGVQQWEDEVSLLKGIRAQVAHILKGHLDKDGNVIQPIPPKALKDLAETVNKSVVAKKHILGEPVGGDENKPGDSHLHLHAHMVKVVNAIEADGSTPTPLTPPAFGIKRVG